MKTGKMIEKKRKELGWKVKDLADKAEIIPAYITQIEQYNKLPSIKVIQKIADHLGLGPELFGQYLIDKEGPEIADYITKTVSTLHLKTHAIVKAPKKKR